MVLARVAEPNMTEPLPDYENMSHDDLIVDLRASGPLCIEAADRIEYLFAQEDLLEETQQRVKALESELAETKRPLDEQMARLNQQIIEANQRAIAAERQAVYVALGSPRAWMRGWAYANREPVGTEGMLQPVTLSRTERDDVPLFAGGII
jgi:hypothetical protein